MASVAATDWQSEHSERLKLAFCLYKYFPHGGLQRDFLRIALACQARGHEVRVYTLSWRGEKPAGFNITIVPVTALTNHTLYERFSEWVQDQLDQDPVDAVIGINKMPGLDVYYAADSCYAEKAHSQRGWLYRLLPRYRHFAAYERAVFGRESSTEILMISEVQKPFFDRYYDTQEDRMQFLPPGIGRDRIAPDNVDALRQAKRESLGLADDEKLVLMVGSGFVKKGLNRALYAIRSLPKLMRQKTRFFVIGDDNAAPFQRLAFLLGIGRQVSILPGQDDVPDFLFAADLLILPALDEAAGIVLLESVVAGTPVLATENCGYSHYITEAEMGEVVPSPFHQKSLNAALRRMLETDQRERFVKRGRRFAESADIYSLHEAAASKIERVAFRQSEKHDKPTVAFCLFKYFPYGGLQRDFLRVADKVRSRGYNVRVYTLLWEGDRPQDFDIVVVPVSAITNHRRYEKFSEWVARDLVRSPVEKVVGFNKMPGLDVYYAADNCFEHKAQNRRGPYYRLLPRYRLFSKFEHAVFGEDADTEILMISPVQKPVFQAFHGTPEARIHMLSPGIERNRMAPANKDDIRKAFRQEMNIAEDEVLLLMIGSGFITKGLDRILIAMSALPDPLLAKTRLIVIGQDAPGSFQRLARKLGIHQRVSILRGRDDIPRFLLGADLLVHPAIDEAAGIVLLEAVVAGLPVLATDNCGYAPYIAQADAGRLIPSPFRQETCNQMLQQMIESPKARRSWSENGIAFSRQADIYDMPSQAAELIISA